MKNNSKFKVIFVIQPDTMLIKASIAEKLDAGSECRATLDLLCVADMLRNMKNVECKLVDCSPCGNNHEKTQSEIKKILTPANISVW
jgi:Ser-tRNA(Ala) deacylase AlaX